ncbi:MAG: hypothetical protein M1546_22740 [Chloroflexi bacterium]|nr:hypothetical protein [Chloroflexota bacterium]
MLIGFSRGEPFATGALQYQYRSVSAKDRLNRIILTVKIQNPPDNDVWVDAILDTGTPYVICEPGLAEALRLNPKDGAKAAINIRGHEVPGNLYRLVITLPAEEGDPLKYEAGVFVPNIKPDEDWTEMPSFIGMSGLEIIRFAVDPTEEMFYFGDPNKIGQ